MAQGFSSIKDRVNSQNELEPLNSINIAMITQKVIGSVVDGIQTDELDEIAARICANMNHVHPDYEDMASRIIISNHHKQTRTRNFIGTAEYLYLANLVNKNYYKFVESNREKIENIINYNRDYRTSYFGFKTLEKKLSFKTLNR